ncbi:MAG: large subunit ribosomal protein [Candidatus Woesearchaeota archaeon]|nr:large subunit ribosomal protein [Candidatus Woesearchaeota archaeon]MDN5327987.1 large subunit ribosomal protein [Candidatus Woesearchaeota archaeon]
MKVFSKSWVSSKNPRKQRKYVYQAPLHLRSAFLHTNLSKELRQKYNVRNIRVVVGDKVKVLRGTYKGTTGKVAKVDLKNIKVFIDSIKVKKADGSEVYVPIHPSNLQIIDLNLKDPKRVQKLKRD